MKSKTQQRIRAARIDGIEVAAPETMLGPLPPYLQKLADRYAAENRHGPRLEPSELFRALISETDPRLETDEKIHDPRQDTAQAFMDELSSRYGVCREAERCKFDFKAMDSGYQEMWKDIYGSETISNPEFVVETRMKTPWITMTLFQDIPRFINRESIGEAMWIFRAIAESATDPLAMDVGRQVALERQRALKNRRASVSNGVKEIAFEREFYTEWMKQIKEESQGSGKHQKAAELVINFLGLAFEAAMLDADLDPKECPYECGTSPYFRWIRNRQDDRVVSFDDGGTESPDSQPSTSDRMDSEHDNPKLSQSMSISKTASKYIEYFKKKYARKRMLQHCKPKAELRGRCQERAAKLFKVEPRAVELAVFRARDKRRKMLRGNGG